MINPIMIDEINQHTTEAVSLINQNTTKAVAPIQPLLNDNLCNLGIGGYTEKTAYYIRQNQYHNNTRIFSVTGEGYISYLMAMFNSGGNAGIYGMLKITIDDNVIYHVDSYGYFYEYMPLGFIAIPYLHRAMQNTTLYFRNPVYPQSNITEEYLSHYNLTVDFQPIFGADKVTFTAANNGKRTLTVLPQPLRFRKNIAVDLTMASSNTSIRMGCHYYLKTGGGN